MATRARKTATAAPTRKTAVRQQPAAPESPDSLLRAGLKALGEVRNDLVRHHTNAIERLLGIQRADGDKPAAPLGFAGLDSFGLRKFEDVFDQRVAQALQRLGHPDAAELQALREEVQQLRAELDALKPPPPPPRRKR